MGTRTGRLDKRLFEPCCDNRSHTMARHHSPSRGRWPAPMRLALTACLALGLTWPGVSDVAHAGDGDIEGKVVIKPNKLGSPPVRNQGFLERIENPLRPIRKFNPWPYMYAVLTDGPMDDEAKKAPGGKVRYHLVGESFEKPLLAVIVNTRVELVNSTTDEVTLFTPDDAAMEESHTFNPRGMSDFKVTEAYDSIVIRSQDTNHLQGRVVAFASRYFVRVNRRGKFEFKDIPEGNWKVRIWYRDGWLDAPEQSIEVEKRRTTDVAVTISPDKVRNSK